MDTSNFGCFQGTNDSMREVIGSIENAGYPNGLPNWGVFLDTRKKQIYQDY